MKVSPARRAAYDVLHEVGARGAYSNLELSKRLKGSDMSPSDRGLATDIVYTCLRHQATIDAVLATVVDRPLAKVDPRVLDILRIGVAEHMYLGKPAHAVVDNAVNLAQSVGAGSAKGFTNAILRKVTARTPEQLLDAALGDLVGDDALEVRYSHPQWIIRAFRDVLGQGGLDDLLAADNTVPRVTLAARPARCAPDDLPGEPTPWSPWGVYLDGGDPGAVAQVRDGRAAVQDLGSQLMVLALSRAPVDCADDAWLDMCAGPGGKAGLMADLVEGSLVCVEQHQHRADLVEQAVAGAPSQTEIVVADATQIEGSFSRVLLDAPCSGLGVLRRRPESRWRRQPSDIPELSSLQRRLLDRAIDVCRPGGVVAYVTCSPHLAETDMIVEDVLAARDDVEQLDAPALLPEVPDCADGLAIRLWPHLHDTDGMYMALLRKV